ncbi:MAG: Lrp/AsnC family transcriptional regulator, partial [archaeon]|nr:Lrp/AsnC family transcriptional regulator [archaeon]
MGAVTLDKIDHKIIQALLEDGRASFSKMAKDVNLTDVAIKKRVEGLKRKGVIASINASINLKVLGYENPIFVQIRTELSKNRDLIKKLNALDYISELYQVLGEYNLIGKVTVPNLESAEKLINDLGMIDGILDIKTMVVLSELKKSN